MRCKFASILVDTVYAVFVSSPLSFLFTLHFLIRPPLYLLCTASFSWDMWKKINNININNLGIRWHRLPLDLTRYLFINSKVNPSNMSTQLTGNTCYFQVYL